MRNIILAIGMMIALGSVCHAGERRARSRAAEAWAAGQSQCQCQSGGQCQCQDGQCQCQGGQRQQVTEAPTPAATEKREQPARTTYIETISTSQGQGACANGSCSSGGSSRGRRVR